MIKLFEEIKRPGSSFVIVSFLLSVIMHRYSFVNSWDELAQWALTVKIDYVLDKLEPALKAYQDYPPASELYLYFWQKLSGEFKDQTLFIAMNVLNASFLAIPLMQVSCDKKWKAIFSCILLWMVPYISYPYYYGYIGVDPFMGTVFAAAICVLLNDRQVRSKNTIVFLCMACAVLVQIKSSGVIFAVCLVVITIANLIFGIKKKKYWIAFLMLACTLISKITWSWKLQLLQASKVWSFEEIPSMEELTVWQKSGFINYFKAIFNHHAIPDTSQTAYALGTVGIPVPLIVWLILILLSLIWIAKREKNRSLNTIFISTFVLCIGYIISISILYRQSFGEGEVAILSSFSRYIGTYLIALTIIVAMHIIQFVWNADLSISKNLWIVILSFFMIYVPANETIFYRIDRQHALEENYNDRKKLKEHIERIVAELPPDAVLHIFNGSIAETSYVSVPIRVASPLWQSGDFEYFRTFADRLGYTHVYFDDIYGSVETPEFEERFSDLFLSPMHDNGLYKVIWMEGKPYLELIRIIK